MLIKSYNILIVEDEFINAQFMEQVLVELGHNVVSNVKNAESAIRITKNNHIDFIFMDINLEGSIDGISCAKILNRDKYIPIIYITAFKDSDILEEAMDTNIYGYLVKPFDKKDIKITLAVAIKQIAKRKNNQNNQNKSKSINLGNSYIYDKETKTLCVKDIPINLTMKESEILYILCSCINKNVSYDILENHVWRDKNISISTIRDTVLRLRKKAPQLDINNIIGVGYCLKNA